MRFIVLALDYDGTIAEDGRLDDAVRAALGEVRRRGITPILVTGRILGDLRRVAGDLRLFDAVVAENGAVFAHPESGRSILLGAPPPAAFLRELERRGIKVEVGECIVEADASEAERILAVIRALELPLVILFNRGRMMVLPQAISKATGLREALRSLRLSPHNAMAIGDAENDHEMLAACELGVAVGWGSSVLKHSADEILEGAGPAAVASYIRRAAAHPRLPPKKIGRRRLLLGSREDGQPLGLAMRGRNVLVGGDPRSGKSWVTGLLCEQLILQQYSIFVIDPEGDYTQLEALPGVIVAGREGHPPRLTELTRLLHHHDVSIVADLSMLAHHEKRQYVAALLHLLLEHRKRTGLPHRIIVDEAHYFLHEPDVLRLLDLDQAGYTLVTYRASLLHPEILRAAEAIIVTRATDPDEVAALLSIGRVKHDTAHWAQALNDLALDEAVLLPATEEAGGELCRFKLAPRLTAQVRHRHKYFDVPVAGQNAFVFTRAGAPVNSRAHSLKEFVSILNGLPDDVLDAHLARSDFSRWLDEVFGDYVLAGSVRELEKNHRMGRDFYVRDAIAQRIEERYAPGEERAID
jgi:hydroxymethylpyrimidine pyrophosphatase-like HAD family hydrolase